MSYLGNHRYDWCSATYEAPRYSGLEQPCLNRAATRCWFCQQRLCVGCSDTCDVCMADFCPHCIAEHKEQEQCPNVFAARILAYLTLAESGGAL